MKKVLLVLALIPVMASVGMAKSPDLGACKKQTFIVTGYYSPLEGQNFYYKGTLEADRKLNGQGVRGASGKAVFNGMIAAPKTYEYGTKIYFPGLGMGQVEDRGGAIVTAGNRNYQYDRIDLWLGSGEEGLKRALSFGKKELVGYICPDGEVGFNMNKFPVYNNLFKDIFWTVSMGLGRTDENVRTLQTHLKDLGYLSNKEITGYFGDKTESALCQFQVDIGLLKNTDKLCGYFGPNTGSYMKMAVLGTEIEGIKVLLANKNPQSKVQLVSSNSGTSKITPAKQTTEKEKLMKISINLTEGVTSYEVRLLQTYLKQISYLTEKEITGIFGPKTKTGLCKFQADIGLLKPTDNLCGSFGPKTGQYLEIALSGATIPAIANSILSKHNSNTNTNPVVLSSNEINHPITSYFTGNLVQGASGEYIKSLQNDLINLGLLNDNEVTYTFGPKTKQALCDFQVQIGLLKADDILCGTFGPKSSQIITLLNAGVNFQELKKYISYGKNIMDNENYKLILSTKIAYIRKDENSELAVLSINNPGSKLPPNKAASSINFSKAYSLGEKNEEIKYLQNYLKEMGFYEGQINGIYDKNTSAGVYKFQLQHNILDGISDPGLKGYFGPKTRSVFSKVISKLDSNLLKQSS